MTVDALKPYKFCDLQRQTSFRVAELLPGSDDDPISCLLHTVDLRGHPDYEAVSYDWSDTSHKGPVVCDNAQIDIPLNLHKSLLHFRLREKSRFIWADALW